MKTSFPSIRITSGKAIYQLLPTIGIAVALLTVGGVSRGQAPAHTKPPLQSAPSATLGDLLLDDLLKVLNVLMGVVLGGIVGVLGKNWGDERKYHADIAHKAEEKLQTYAKPLWRSCQELRFRLQIIRQSLRDGDPVLRQKELEPLRWSPKDAGSLSWFNQSGQFVTSTAYLIAVVSAWITLFERDVVFLPFRKASSTTEFFGLVEQFKSSIGDHGSVLFYNYFQGIGSRLLLDDQSRPMPIDSFSYRLYQDEMFRSYYEQLFAFIHQVADGEFGWNLEHSIESLDKVMDCLLRNGAIKEIGRANSETNAQPKNAREPAINDSEPHTDWEPPYAATEALGDVVPSSERRIGLSLSARLHSKLKHRPR